MRGLSSITLDVPEQLEAYFARYSALTLVAAPLIRDRAAKRLKTRPDNVTEIQRAVEHYGIDRHSYIVAVGGGALLDMVGYAAATSHRGVRLVQSADDGACRKTIRAVGVKNGVNAFGKKNFLGTFAPPYAVLNDLNFLDTLAQRDWVGGLSEAVKVSLLKRRRVFRVFRSERGASLKNCDREAMAHAVVPAAPNYTWSTSPPAAIRLSSARHGRSTLVTGPHTSSRPSPHYHAPAR